MEAPEGARCEKTAACAEEEEDKAESTLTNSSSGDTDDDKDDDKDQPDEPRFKRLPMWGKTSSRLCFEAWHCSAVLLLSDF